MTSFVLTIINVEAGKIKNNLNLYLWKLRPQIDY